MKTIDECAGLAERDIGRWYGRRMTFDAPREPVPPFREWIKEHWRRFPMSDPTGGQIIDGEAIEISGFLE